MESINEMLFLLFSSSFIIHLEVKFVFSLISFSQDFSPHQFDIINPDLLKYINLTKLHLLFLKCHIQAAQYYVYGLNLF